jgi:hypothetical protein
MVGGTMKGIVTRPRSLLLVVALTAVAALCTVSPANAASPASDSVVSAAPSNLTAKAVGTTSVQLTWTNNAGNQSGVVISLDGQESLDLQGATVSSYTWNGLSPNTKYWFYVASKIYGTPGDPTGYGNTQSAWVGPAYATTVGAQPSTSPAQPPSTSPAQPPSTTGSGVPTTLPTQPSPTFVCVTGPGGSCLQPGAGLPVPQTWTPTVPGWVTSGVTGGCVAEFLTLDSVELWTLFEKMGDAIQFDESNGNFFVLLSAATSEVIGLPAYCSRLGYDLLTGKPVPQTIDYIRGTASPQSRTVLDSVTTPASTAAAEPVPAGARVAASLDREAAVPAPALRRRGRPGRGGGGAEPEVPGRMGRGHAEERGVPTAARRLPLPLELSAERRSSLRLRPHRGDG